MLAMLIFLNAHNLPIFQPILMILVSKLMVHRAFSDKTYLLLGLLSPLTCLLILMNIQIKYKKIICISDHAMKGLYISFTLISSLVV